MAKRRSTAVGKRAASRSASTATPRNLPLLYVESSALLAALLEQDFAARQSLEAVSARVTSALTFAEASRAVLRARSTGRLDAAMERLALRWLQTFRTQCDVVAVNNTVLARSGRPFPAEPIRTLDAIHLATAELLGEPPQLVTILTRDVRVADNARALGYAVI